MTKRIEFHQAQLTVVLRAVDDDRSYGTQVLRYDMLLNTDAEWNNVRALLAEQMEQLQEQLDGDSKD